MSTTEKTTNIVLDAMIYLEAPNSYEETESGKVILSSSELMLPGDISFNLNKLKTAKYEKIEDKHIIKVTTSSGNEIYFTIIGASKLKTISYAETISNMIQDFNPTASQSSEPQATNSKPPESEERNTKPKTTDSEKTENSENDKINSDHQATTNENQDSIEINLNATTINRENNKSSNNSIEVSTQTGESENKNNITTKDKKENITIASTRKTNDKDTIDYPIYIDFDWGYFETCYYRYGGKSYVFHPQEVRTNRDKAFVDLTYFVLHLGRNNKIIKRITTTIQAYDRVNDPINEPWDANFTGPLKPKESHEGDYFNFFTGNSYLRINSIKIIKIIIDYMDGSSIKITDDKMIKTMNSEAVAHFKLDPPSYPPIYMSVFKWEIKEQNIKKDDVIYDNLKVKIGFCRNDAWKPKDPNQISVTLQAYDKFGNPIAVLEGRLYNGSVNDMVRKECSLIIADIKITGVTIVYNVYHYNRIQFDEYVEIKDKNMINAMTSSTEATQRINNELKQREENEKEYKRLHWTDDHPFINGIINIAIFLIIIFLLIKGCAACLN